MVYRPLHRGSSHTTRRIRPRPLGFCSCRHSREPQSVRSGATSPASWFSDLDFDNERVRARFLGSDSASSCRGRRCEAAETGPRDHVERELPGGAEPGPMARACGAEPIWLDSDRGAALGVRARGGRARPSVLSTRSRRTGGSARSRASSPSSWRRARGRCRPPLLPRPVRVGDARPLDRAPGRRSRIAGGLALAAVAAAAAAGALTAGPHGTGHPTRVALASGARHSRPAAALPQRGVLVSGRSLAGVRLGDTMRTVRAVWGHNFTRCRGCKPAEWFYFRPTGDPVRPSSSPGGASSPSSRWAARRGGARRRDQGGPGARQPAPVPLPGHLAELLGLQRQADPGDGRRGDRDPDPGSRGVRLRAVAAVGLAVPLTDGAPGLERAAPD